MTTQNNRFKLMLKITQKTCVSNVNLSNENFRLCWNRVCMLKFDSIVASTGTTQIIHRGHIYLQSNPVKCAIKCAKVLYNINKTVSVYRL